MFNTLKVFDAKASNGINPYAVDVIRAKRRDLLYGMSRTGELLDRLVAEGVATAGERSILLAIGTRKDQNAKVLDILEARGERACRKFFHPCLMLAEPDLYRQIKTYVAGANEQIKDTRRQLIGYLLEREREGTAGIVTQTHKKTCNFFAIEEAKRLRPENEDCSPVPPEKLEDKAPRPRPENLTHTTAADGELVPSQELLEDANINSVSFSDGTLLHEAAKRGHLSIVELLIREGARLDLQDDNGHTALHSAASEGHVEIVRALITAGTPIYTLDLQGKTPMHLAAEKQDLECVKVLVEQEARQPAGRTRDTFLHAAATEDDWRLAELLLQSGAAVDARNTHKKTALCHAVARSDARTASVLLNAGATVDPNLMNEAIQRNDESTLRLLLANAGGALSEEALGSALFSAVRQNHGGAVTALTDSGADVNTRDKQGYTPLLLSAELGHADVFGVLVAQQAKVEAILPSLSSALHLAVLGGSVPIVQTLLEKGLDPNVSGPKAQPPLHLAAQCSRSDLVGLLSKAGARVNAVTQDGLTPLHLASQQGHADTVKQLLQVKADLGLKDRLGRTALHWAASSGESSVVDLLLSAKAKPTTADNEKKTALHLAAMEGALGAVTSLLSHKAKGGAKDMDGSTPLHYAAAGGHAGVVAALLQSRGNKGLEERNAWRKTALHAAAEKGHDRAAVLLLEAGAKINTTDQSKDTPLHCAARGGHQDVVKTFINWGQGPHTLRKRKVNLQATNNVGKTPLQVAESGATAEHDNIASLLKRKMLLIK